MYPAEAKSILAEIFIQDEVKDLFGNYYAGSIAATVNKVKDAFKSHYSDYKKAQGKVELLTEQLEKMSEIPEWLMEEYNKSIKMLQPQLNPVNTEALFNKKKTLELQLLQLEKEIDKVKAEIAQLRKGICPTCGSELSKDVKLLEEKELYLETLSTKKQELIVEQAWVLDEITKIAQSDTKQISEEYTQLIAKRTRLEESIKNRAKMETEQEFNINKLIELSNSDIADLHEETKPKGKINRFLQDKLQGLVEWYDITLFEGQDRGGEDKSTFKVYKDWIEYRELSRSEQAEANIKLSVAILNKLDSPLPIVIDNAEMLDEGRTKELEKVLKQRPYLAAIVTEGDLLIEEINNEANTPWESNK